MATARKLPSGNWRVMVYDGKDAEGKRVYRSFTGPTKKAAEYSAAEYMAGKKHSKNESITVGEAIDRYISSKDSVLSPTTVHNYRVIRQNNLQSIMEIPIDNLTQEDIQSAVNAETKRISSRGKPVSAKTVINAHGLLVSALKMFRPDMRIDTTLPRKIKTFKEYPTAEQVIAIIRGEEIELPVLCGLWLGLRMSEIRGIKKSAISGDILTVNNVIVTVNGKPVEKSLAKTDATVRKIKLPSIMLDMIEQVEGEYLTTLTGQALYKRFSRLMAHNGWPGIRFHDLRHISASTMLMLGIPDKYAAERGGWATTHIMNNVYQHTFSSERESVDFIVDKHYSEIYATQNATRISENNDK